MENIITKYTQNYVYLTQKYLYFGQRPIFHNGQWVKEDYLITIVRIASWATIFLPVLAWIVRAIGTSCQSNWDFWQRHIVPGDGAVVPYSPHAGYGGPQWTCVNTCSRSGLNSCRFEHIFYAQNSETRVEWPFFRPMNSSYQDITPHQDYYNQSSTLYIMGARAGYQSEERLLNTMREWNQNASHFVLTPGEVNEVHHLRLPLRLFEFLKA